MRSQNGVNMFDFWKKKQNDNADIAKVIMKEFVNRTDLDTDYRKEYGDKKTFIRKCICYRIAIVLIVLISEEKNNEKLLILRERFEELVFGKQTHQSMELLKDIQKAMTKLKELLFAQSPPMEWGINWLTSIGIEESNPLNVFSITTKWMDFYIACAQTIKKIQV